MEGMPERVSVANSIRLTSFPGLAYSLRYTAAPTPMGRAASMVSTTIIRVFSRFPAMPTVPLSLEVTVVRKAQLTLPTPRISTYRRISASRATDRKAQK